MKITIKQIMDLIQEVFNSLEQSGVIEAHLEVNEDIVLIGPNAALDSIAFVTFFMDMEERLGELTGQEIYLLIDEIHTFNPEDTFLTVKILVDFIANKLAAN